MKIPSSKFCYPVQPGETPAKSEAVSKGSKAERQDDVSLSDIRQAAETMSKPEVDEEIDLERVKAASAKMIDGNYDVPDEMVADAIIEELSWIEKWME